MSIHVVCEESVSSVKSNQQSKQSGHLIEVMGPKGPLSAGSVAWVEGAGNFQQFSACS